MKDSFAEKLLNYIIETSNNNITITDAEGIILQSNPEHWSVYGLKADEYKGKSVYQLEREEILTPSISAMVLREKKPVQILQHTQTGKVIMTKGYPLFDDDGTIVRVVSYAQDQTEIRRLQEQYEQLERKLQGYQTEVEELRRKEGIHFRSKEMQQIANTIHRVAESDATVLFLGESGVGKSMFAHELHNRSQRSEEPFIEVNCSTIPENLFESEMFGYEAGSFTGATKKGKQGLIEQAHNGTLFLDEIGELPLSMQVKLLKVLQEKKFMRIGGKKEQHIDFRLVTATNQNLEEMVEKGKFRLDLFYRLNVIPLHIPPLRERKDEIPFLINHYIDLINAKYKTAKKLHAATYESLIAYKWPGNVRELENLMERLILTTEGTTIYPNDLPPSINCHPISKTKETKLQRETTIQFEELKHLDLNSAIEKVEEHMILRAAQTCKTTYEMAELLGISQPSVVRKLKKYKGVRHHQRTK
ncbi:sigma 54-interacting transcriptional regulator [Niallia oryzisoli]|uniref:HTH-type transcriptional regulatory protein TyrR n=1 Tax=Niallia oryzisoli TaxID=1737571 RepID=A0ABZ2CFV0_9BACI